MKFSTVTSCGAFADGDKILPAAVFFDNVSRCAITHCIFDAPGTFWYYGEKNLGNTEHEVTKRKTHALHIIGNENRIRNNTFLNSSCDSIAVIGDKNVLISNIVDGNVRISGKNNTISNLIFTKNDSRLILEGDAAKTTVILGVEESRIVRI